MCVTKGQQSSGIHVKGAVEVMKGGVYATRGERKDNSSRQGRTKKRVNDLEAPKVRGSEGGNWKKKAVVREWEV